MGVVRRVVPRIPSVRRDDAHAAASAGLRALAGGDSRWRFTTAWWRPASAWRRCVRSRA